jgi:hypothetical protein
MGVYIKGMEKPKECTACPSGLSVRVGCDAFFTGNRPRGRVREDCPLVEVNTPHGRLVDTTTAYQDTMQYGEHFRKSVLRIINDLPTVIEAEVE